MAGTGTLWVGGVAAGSSLGRSQMGAVASRVPGESVVSGEPGSEVRAIMILTLGPQCAIDERVD